MLENEKANTVPFPMCIVIADCADSRIVIGIREAYNELDDLRKMKDSFDNNNDHLKSDGTIAYMEIVEHIYNIVKLCTVLWLFYFLLW